MCIRDRNYAPGILIWNTDYYYQIVPRNIVGPASGCPINQFRTATLLEYSVLRQTGISYGSISSTGNSVTSWKNGNNTDDNLSNACLLYTSPSPRDRTRSRMPSSA